MPSKYTIEPLGVTVCGANGPNGVTRALTFRVTASLLGPASVRVGPVSVNKLVFVTEVSVEVLGVKLAVYCAVPLITLRFDIYPV